MRNLIITTLVSISISLSFQSFAFSKEGSLRDIPKMLRQEVVDQVNMQLDIGNDSLEDNGSDEIWPLSMASLRTFAFLEFDVLFFEMKIKPYIELRWLKKNPENYKPYHPLN